MKIQVLTLFPEAFGSFLTHSIMKRAQEAGRVSIRTVDLRDFTHDKHRTADDRPFGGGAGMVLKPEPIFEAYGASKRKKDSRFIYLTPSGRRFDQKLARELALEKDLTFLCGHYEGVDQRVLDELVTDEVSIGDYVLTQGELPAMVLIDSVVRLVPGVLGNEGSKEFESFTGNLLEYPHYTRPAVYRGLKVPEVLMSGDHQKIADWRNKQAHKRTLERRPDLLGAGRPAVHSKKKARKR
jgi:tRNA (guanine37-N1)-methyltransferase